MKTEVLLPQLGFAMSEGTIAEWFAKDGQRVSAGQPIYSVESDKAVQEIESPADGTLQILKQAGGPYPVGELLAEIVSE